MDRATVIKKDILLPDSHNGFIIAGVSNSFDGNITNNHGNNDYWVLKIDNWGNIQWQKSYGGSNYEDAYDIQPTFDGGYIVVGHAYSNDSDVSGNHGSDDYWVVKLSDSGVIQWQKCLGGSQMDRAFSIEQTLDSGYIIAGNSESNDGDASGNHGRMDYWVVKLSSIGIIEWQKSYGGTFDDFGRCAKQTQDGGYIVSGYTRSNDGDVTGYHGGEDIWIIKIDDTGIIQWQKTFGGSSTDWNNSVIQTFDGGYIIAGQSYSVNGDVSGNHGFDDFWVVKLSSVGSIQWQKCYGGPIHEGAYLIQQTADSGYIIVGGTDADGGNVSGNHGLNDSWMIKVNDTGTLLWQKCLGKTYQEASFGVQQTLDSGYILAGYSSSTYDVTNNHDDYWIVKLLPCYSINPTIVDSNSILTVADVYSNYQWLLNGLTIPGATNSTYYGWANGDYSVNVTDSIGCSGTSLIHHITNGISTVNYRAISIHPNPTTSNISVTGASDLTINTYNILGQLITSATNTNNISIAEFPAGLYFVQVFNEHGELLKQEKVIKQ